MRQKHTCTTSFLKGGSYSIVVTHETGTVAHEIREIDSGMVPLPLGGGGRKEEAETDSTALNMSQKVGGGGGAKKPCFINKKE